MTFPAANSILVTVTLTEAATGNAVTDAVLTAIVQDQDGDTVSGSSTSLSHGGSGSYSGVITGPLGLTVGHTVNVRITASNYVFQINQSHDVVTRTD